MPNIYVDTNALNDAISNFEMSYKELEELIYRVNVLGNEMLDDAELALMPGSEHVTELCSSLSYELVQLKMLYSSIVDFFIKVPAMYSDIEQKTVEKISELVLMSNRINTNAAAVLFDSTVQEDDDGGILQASSLEQEIKNERDSLDLADAAILLNDTDGNENADISSVDVENDVKRAREQADLSADAVSTNETDAEEDGE